MIRTKNLIAGVTDVPSMWVFEKWLRLPQRLSGQDMMIKSIFNSKDRRPSMSIFVDKKGPQYRYYDHSTGKRGDKIDLVGEIEGLEFRDACDRLVSEYNKYILEGNGCPVAEFKEHNKYQVVEWKRRKWNVLDRGYWTQYEIGSRELEYFQAWPLDYYRLDNGEKELIITGEYIYGYFTSLGELYKVYQPMVKDRRFLKVKQYIQGWDQLRGEYSTLIVTKALKDIMTLHTLSLGCEYISPDSETSLIRETVMQDLKGRYQHVLTLFDNDDAGRAASGKYKDKYGTPGIILPLEKDPSDSVKKYGGETVARTLKELIANKLIMTV